MDFSLVCLLGIIALLIWVSNSNTDNKTYNKIKVVNLLKYDIIPQGIIIIISLVMIIKGIFLQPYLEKGVTLYIVGLSIWQTLSNIIHINRIGYKNISPMRKAYSVTIIVLICAIASTIFIYILSGFVLVMVVLFIFPLSLFYLFISYKDWQTLKILEKIQDFENSLNQ